MRASTRARIEEHWAERLQMPGVALLRTPGLSCIAHPQPDAFFILAREQSVVAAGPAAWHDRLAALRPDQLCERDSLVALLPPGARCVGPAFVGYLDVPPAAPSAELRRLGSARDPACESLRASATAEEWSHAALDAAEAPLFAFVEEGRAQSAAGARMLLESVAHIGVLTHPAARGRGLARQVVAALARDVLERGLLPQYQTLMSNAASLAVGTALGFERFALTFGGSWPAGATWPEPIYHLVPESELRAGLRDDVYLPAGFAADGFVHCSASPGMTLAVARAFYASVAESLLVLRIDPARLGARLVFEAAAPPRPPGIAEDALFPHVYGPIDRAAISGVGIVERHAGEPVWPRSFEPFERTHSMPRTSAPGLP